jgi:hypothetical protein
MTELSTALLSQACNLFMELAYPDGPTTMPAKKRAYFQIDPARPVTDFLPPAPDAASIAKDLSTRKDGPRGYEFRLGSVHFPHLKLHIQRMEHRGDTVWIFAVDTHDAFSRHAVQPPADHPEAAAWTALQDRNRELKERIEDEFEHAGLLTFKSLLRSDLGSPVQR